MTKDEFIKQYCNASGINEEYFHKWRVALPCDCDYEGCQGWAAIPNDPDSIKSHNMFYNPEYKEVRDASSQ